MMAYPSVGIGVGDGADQHQWHLRGRDGVRVGRARGGGVGLAEQVRIDDRGHVDGAGRRAARRRPERSQRAATPFLAPSSVHASWTSCQASRTTSKAETASGSSFCHPSVRAPCATEAIRPKRSFTLGGSCIRSLVSGRPARPFHGMRHHTDLDDRLSRQLRVIRMTSSRFGQSGRQPHEVSPAACQGGGVALYRTFGRFGGQ